MKLSDYRKKQLQVHGKKYLDDDDWYDFKQGKFAVVCETREEAEDFIMLLHAKTDIYWNSAIYNPRQIITRYEGGHISYCYCPKRRQLFCRLDDPNNWIILTTWKAEELIYWKEFFDGGDQDECQPVQTFDNEDYGRW